MRSKAKAVLHSPAAAAILAALWAMELRNTEAYYSVYLVCAILAAFSAAKGYGLPHSRGLLRLCSALIALCVTAANNALYVKFSPFIELLRLALLFLLSYGVFLKISALVWHLLDAERQRNGEGERRLRPAAVFALSFVIILAVYLSSFFLAAYPGNLSTDSINQLEQIITGSYSNHHPYYHTQLIRLFFSLGLWLFHDVNRAVATYMVFQMTAMAAIFAFSISTLSCFRVRQAVLAAVLAVYAFLPQHWIYASTMWKDVLFGGMCLLLVTALARYRGGLGSRKVSMGLFVLASVGVCLFRSNGLFAYAFFAAALLARGKRNGKALVAAALVALAVSWTLKVPVLKALDVPQPDTVESLSVPLQQLARVIDSDGDLGEQQDYIYSIMDPESVKQKYWAGVSDGVKEICRSMGANEIIDADPMRFVRAWAEIGLKNPVLYFRAWVGQTCGYYNAGYVDWFAFLGVEPNELGISGTRKFEPVNWLYDRIASGEDWLLCLLVASGALTWLYIILAAYEIAEKGRCMEGCVLALSIVLSLLIATPMVNALRYVYGLYTMIPFLTAAAPAEENPEQQEKNQ